MTKRNEENERIKRKYRHYLQQASGKSEATLDKVAASLARFEASTGAKSFKLFHTEQAVAFKVRLQNEKNPKTKEHLSLATVNSILGDVKTFFKWLAWQPGYKSRISPTDADYFSLPMKDVAAATAYTERPYPSLEQALHAFRQMPSATVIQRRSRAVLALLLITGIRDTALTSLKLKHIDLVARAIYQNGREVRTKASKTITTYLLPLDPEVEAAFDAWVEELMAKHLFGPSDPLFPKTLMRVGAGGGFEVAGLSREHWATASPVRAIVRDAFAAASLPHFTPHAFRRTLQDWAAKRCQTPEEYKALSQNLGHESVLTTFASYGTVARERQREIIRGMG
ncbi:MAG: site-specific integrase [Pseudomonadota bacterium]